MNRIVLLALLFFYFLSGCKDKGTDINVNAFIVKIHVVNSQGVPVPDMNISIWDKIQYKNNGFNKSGLGGEITYQTNIMYTVAESSFVDLSYYDLENKLIGRKRDRSLPGNFVISNYTPEGNTVYKFVMTASRDSLMTDIIYSKFIYMTSYAPYPDRPIGKTDNTGTFTVSNKALFPSLYNLPEMPVTTEFGPEIANIFTFSGNTIISVSNQDNSKYKTFEVKVLDGENLFNLVVDDSMQIANNRPSKILKPSGIKSVTLDSFTGSFVETNKVVLNWKTLDETNNRGFEILKSTHGSSWITIGFENGMGTTNQSHTYSFTEKVPNGSYYYKLKIVDLSGNYEYSDHILISSPFPGEWELRQNYPNPYN